MSNPETLFDDACAVILDGGRATRMGGIHKAFLEVGGEPIAHHTLRELRKLVSDITVATSRRGPWATLGVRLVADPVRDAGPLAGIAAGLSAAPRPLVLVVASDMPHLTAPALGRLLTRARREVGRAVVPRLDGRAEPLHAVYPAALAAQAHRCLLAGVRKLTDFLEAVPTTWVDADELADGSATRNPFASVNRPDDLPRRT